MNSLRGSSLLSDLPLQKATNPSKTNIFLGLSASTFSTLIGYIYSDIVFAITLHFVAQNNDTKAVAGLGIAFTIVNIIVIPMALEGINSSLSILSSQALGGGKFRLSQTYFSLSIIIHLCYYIPISLLVIALQYPILKLVDPEDRKQTADYCQTYLLFLLVSAFFANFYEATKSYMISHKIFMVFMCISIFTTSLHYLWCLLLIKPLGIVGAGLSIIMTEFLNCLGVLIAIVCFQFSAYENFSFNFKWQKHKKLLFSYFKTSIPIIGHIYADFFVFFLMNFIALTFGIDSMNAQLALSNTSNVYYKFPIALSVSLMSYIGNEMGSRNIPRAVKYTWLGILFYVISTCLFVSLLIIFKNEWAIFYSPEEEIQDLILQVHPIFVQGYFFIDGLQGTLTGILKGIEQKKFVTYTTLLVYYLIGIPSLLFFSYNWGFGKKLYGIWLAFAMTNGILAVLYLILLLETNWREASDKICSRIEKQNKMQNIEDSLNSEFEEINDEIIRQVRKHRKAKKIQDSNEVSEDSKIKEKKSMKNKEEKRNFERKKVKQNKRLIERQYSLPGQN